MRSMKVSLALSAVVLMVATVSQVHANTAYGTVKSVSPTEIVVTDDNGKDWTYRLMENAVFACPEGPDAKITSLKPGAMVGVLYGKKDGKYEAAAVLHNDGIYRNSRLTQGKVMDTQDDNNKIVIADPNGKDFTYSVSDSARIRLSNKNAKLNAFKKGDAVVFVYDKQGDRYTIVSICDCPTAR